MLYLETKWASLIPFVRATDLLKEVLPVGDLVNAETVRNHLQLTAERIEQELGEERQLNRLEGSEQEWERQPLPDGPITVGIDGVYVRAAHRAKAWSLFGETMRAKYPRRSVSGSFKPTTRNRDSDYGS
jgi:hypothetical protein